MDIDNFSPPPDKFTSDSEKKKRVQDIGHEIGRLQEEKKQLLIQLGEWKIKRCSFCGSDNYYAKGLCKNCYARNRKNGTPEKQRKPKAQKPIIPWRIRLGIVVVGSDFPVPEDYNESVDFVLSTLTAREKEVLISRYNNCMTLADCGIAYGVSKERIRQIQSRAIRKLRHPSRSIYFTDGKKSVESIKNQPPIVRDISLEDMQLSVRAFNCLYRANLKTLADVIDYIDGDETNLFRLRGCGRAVIEEIVSAIDKFAQTERDIESLRRLVVERRADTDY